jgi:hypothetical protein
MSPKKDSLEISSEQIHGDLKEIKERIGALETIASLANRPTVEAYVKTVLTTAPIKAIVAACEGAKTKKELCAELGYKSIPALDHHLSQIRQHDVLQSEINDDGELAFRWSNLFARLPKNKIKELLGADKQSTVAAKVIKDRKNG